MSYVAGIAATTTVWPPSAAPLLPQTRSGRGRPQTRLQRDGEHQPISVKALALSLPKEAWQTVAWREGSAERLSSRFIRQRVRPAHRDAKLSQPRAEEWLLVEWPEHETEPTKYWFATLPEISPSIGWSTWPNCAGGSSAITRSSSRNSAWVIMKGAGGAGSTTTPHSVSPPTGF